MIQGIKNGIPIIIESTNVEHDWWVNSYFGGIWEPESFLVFDRLLTPDMTILDLGTFEGHTVLYEAHKVKMVYGLECDPLAYENLWENIRANKLENVMVNLCAISDKDGEDRAAGQTYDPNIFGHSGTRLDKNGTIQVFTTTIESFLKKHQIQKIDFVKMDIEGGEEFVIPAMINFLKEHKPILYISFHPHLMANREFDSEVNYQTVDKTSGLKIMLEEIYPFRHEFDFKTAIYSFNEIKL